MRAAACRLLGVARSGADGGPRRRSSKNELRPRFYTRKSSTQSWDNDEPNHELVEVIRATARAPRLTGRTAYGRRAEGRCCSGLRPRLTWGTDKGEEGGYDEGLIGKEKEGRQSESRRWRRRQSLEAADRAPSGCEAPAILRRREGGL
jgi:hypothetical protein